MKRLLSIFFTLCLVVALSLSVSAESTNKLTYAVGASAPTVSANTEFTVLVDITENTGICWLKAVVTYDSSVLSYVSASTDTSVFDPAKITVNHRDGKVIVVLGNLFEVLQSPKTYTNTGRFISLTFKAKSGAVGETTINVETTDGDAMNIVGGTADYDFAVNQVSTTVKVLTNAEHTCVAGAEVRENEKPATCNAMGSYESVTYCTACGAEMSRKTVVIPINDDHIPGEATKENVVAGTCQKAETYDMVTRCTRCNKIVKTENKTGSMADHVAGTPKVEYTASTCVKKGMFVETYTCKHCGKELDKKSNELPLVDHVPGSPEKENEKPATCSAKGSYESVVHCTVCDEKLSSEVVTTDMIEHTTSKAVEENRKESKDCLTPGSYDFVVYCSECKKELSRETIALPVLAHTPGNPPTETEPQTCVVCGYVLLPPLGHTHRWGETFTSNQEGHWYACEGCGEKKDYAAHVFDNKCDATCNTCGMTRTVSAHVYDNDCDDACNYCGSKRTVTHKYDNACDTTCNVCGATRTVPAHKYDNDCDITCNICGVKRNITHKYDNDCDSTCNVCGTERDVTHKYDNNCDTTCNVCGTKRSVTHKYDNNCDATCNVCGEKRTPADHVYGSWTTVTAPTATEIGYRERSCNVCGNVVSEIIPATGEVSTDEPDVTTEPPVVTTDGPEVTTDGPEVTTDGSEVTTDGPDVTTEHSDVTTDPEVTTKPSDVTEPNGETGCGSAVSMGIALIAILGTALIMKKRD